MKPPCDEAVVRSEPASVPCSRKLGPWILAATILGSSMAFIDSTVVNVALPALQSRFGASVVDVQWVVEAYGLFLGALILVGGSVGDLFGRRRVFVIGVTMFALASMACGFAQDIYQLITARALQGIGAAFLVPGSLAIISASFREEERGKAIGTWSGFTAITTAIGPVLGGWLIEHASWRWAFFINVPIAAAVIGISVWRVPESRSTGERHIDWLGAVLATVGLGGLVYGLIESSRNGWRDTRVMGSLIGGTACVLAFVYVEKKARFPMVPLELFRSRLFAGANLLTFFLYSAIGVLFFLFSLDLIQVQHYSATAAGAAALPMILLMFLLSSWSGGLVARYGPTLPLATGPLIAAAGFCLLAISGMASSYWTSFFPAFVVLGLGLAVSVAPLTTVVMNAVDQSRAGTASGINNAVARVAGLLAIAVLGIFMVRSFSTHLEHNLAGLSLPPDVVHELESNRISLAAIEIPSGLDSNVATAVKTAVDRAFLSAFRLVMFMCAGLCVLSAVCAKLLIAGKAGMTRPSGVLREGLSAEAKQ